MTGWMAGAPQHERPAAKDNTMARNSFTADLSPPINERDHAQGSEDAPLTLVQYGDYPVSRGRV
jgi:hypothetical protein